MIMKCPECGYGKIMVSCTDEPEAVCLREGCGCQFDKDTGVILEHGKLKEGKANV